MDYDAVSRLLGEWRPPASRGWDSDGPGRGGDAQAGATGDDSKGDRCGDFPLERLRDAAGPDWVTVKDRPELLHALALALETRRQRERGEQPASYTLAAVCDGCGPVWLWPGAPTRVLACPWCHVRGKVALPRPPTG